MAGRFPFDSHSGQTPNQLNPAQLRAAMGMSGMDELYLRQQQENIQRDLHFRQILLQQELQLDQQNKLDSISMLHEQQLRAIGEQLQDFPDLQQHYSRLLLNEQLQRHEERALMREHAQIRYQEELRRQQQQLAAAPAAAAAAAAAATTAQQQVAAVAASSASAQNVARLGDLAAVSLAGNAVKKTVLERKRSPSSASRDSFGDDDVAEQPSKRLARDIDREREREKEQKTPLDGKPKAKSRLASGTNKKAVPPPPSSTPDSQASMKESSSEKSGSTPTNIVETTIVDTSPSTEPVEIIRYGNVEDLLAAAETEEKADHAVNALNSLKTIIWSDSEESNDEDGQAEMHKEDQEHQVQDQEVGDNSSEMTPVKEENFSITPLGFTYDFPLLPEEPLYEEKPYDKEKVTSLLDDDGEERDPSKKRSDSTDLTEDGARDDTLPKARTVSNVLDYPYPIDTWWPSLTTIRRERRANSETSDEDDFDEEPELARETSPLRANAEKIRARLTHELKPGLLEKLPHCKIHRLLMKRKKNISAPELVHCWQVTEIYPNDIMVCCSICGTWRHAACGGHYKPYSVRENIKTPVTPVCDFCYREEIFLKDYPEGRQRLERQRIEQLRRGLATSAVMRQASFSKHGGTYKWPLGRVSATHIGGHTRSVHSRHDKAEKQWTDMANRLGRGYGYRPKERMRIRTKELERLLVSVEDAEAQTDRHNMLLFLLEDTAKRHPVGFERLRRNIFDPEEDEICETESEEGGDEDSDKAMTYIERVTTDDDFDGGDDTPGGNGVEKMKLKLAPRCARDGCCQKPRFDSLFCSDSCGVSALEIDLLRSFQDSSDIHPSVLRN